MLWFLARLSAQLDSIRSEFAAAHTGDPAGATSRVDPAASPATTTSTSTTARAVAGTDEYAIVAASAEVAPELVVLPGVFSSTIKVQEVLEITHHASLDCIATTPMTCSTECPNQVTVTSSLASPVMTAPLLPATTPVLAIDLIHSATNGDSNLWAPLAMEDELLTMPSPRIFSAINSLQLLMDSGMDVSKPTICSRFCLPDTTMLPMMAMVFPQIWRKRMRLRPTPWPSFWMDLTDGNELMTPCILQKSSYEFHAQDVQPRFRFSQDNVHLKLSRPSAAICVFCTVLFGNQSMMLHDGLRRGMQHQADQLEETYYANCVLEHASTPDKLQKAMHNLNMLVWCPLLNQRKFVWSGTKIIRCSGTTSIASYQVVHESISIVHAAHLMECIQCLKLENDRPHDCWTFFQPTSPWHPYGLAGTIRKLLVIAGILTAITSKETRAWTGTNVYIGKCCHLALQHYNKMSYSLDARAMQCSGTITLDMLVKAEFIPSICTALSSKGKTLGTTARVLLLCFRQQPLRNYFRMPESSLVCLCVPAILIEDSVQHWVIHVCTSIRDGSDQCRRECSTLSLYGKWVLKSCTSQTVKVCNPLEAADQHQEGKAVPACPDVTNGCEAGVADVEYIDYENLTYLPDGDTSPITLLARLGSKECVKTCEALNNVRQLAIYQKQRLPELLEFLVPLIVKSVKYPRSDVCQTAEQHEWYSRATRSSCIPSWLDWKFNLNAYWYRGTSLRSSTFAVCQVMTYELMLFRERQLEIFRLQLDDDNCHLLFRLQIYYLLLSVITMWESDLYIYQLSISWDPGGLILLLSLKLAHRVVLQAGACVVILDSRYFIHASDISLRRLPGLQSAQVPSTCYNQGHFQEGRGTITIVAVFAQGFVDHEYYFLGFDHDYAENDYFLDTFFSGAPIGHNYCSYFIEVHPSFDRDYTQVKHNQVQWDPGGFWVVSAWGQAEFKKGGVSEPSPGWYMGLAVDRYMGLAHRETIEHHRLQVPWRRQRSGHPVDHETRRRRLSSSSSSSFPNSCIL